MAFTRLTIKQLYQRIKSDMEARLTGDVKIPPTSMLSVAAFGMAGGSYLVQGFLEWIYKQILPDLADETGIGRWSTILKVPRKSEEFTTGYVAFTGTAATVVPSGTQVQNGAGLAYDTQASFTIGTDTQVEVVAIEAGAAWNDTTGMEVVSPASGVDDTVTIVSGFADGQDLETFDNWVVRILQRLQNPPSSGTPPDYVRWALEMTGVTYAWCFAAEDWNGAGTVGVAVSDTDHDQLSQSFLDNTVEPYIEALKPAPAKITYYSPTPIVVDYQISITPNITDTQDAITTNMQELFDADSEPAGSILISRANNAVSSSAVGDYEITGIDVDGVPVAVGNVAATIAQVQQLGTLTFSDL